MDGTVEAHNISFSCGLLGINITLPHEENDLEKNRDFWQRSKTKPEEKNGWWSSFHLLSSQPPVLAAQSDISLSCF